MMHFSGEVMVGIYSSLVYMLRPGILLVTSTFQVAIRKLSALHHRQDDRQSSRLLTLLLLLSLAVSFVMTAVFWMFGDWLLALVFGTRFQGHGALLVLVSLNNFLALPAAMLSYYGIVRRRFRLQPLVVAVTILCNFLFSVTLVFSIPSGWREGKTGPLTHLPDSISPGMAQALLLLQQRRSITHRILQSKHRAKGSTRQAAY